MKNYRYRVLVLAMAALQQSSPVWALSPDEEELALVYGDKFTVSIAAGSAQPIRRAPAVATVITAEDIAAMGATNIDEVLETVPGMHINRAASMNSTLYVMRGVFSSFSPQVLMLQNGIPVTVMITGNKGSLWGGLPLENIARIEVIRGPGSALYGADAYAGVVNVITKTAADTPGTQFGVRAGSFSTGDMWAQHGGKLGALDVAAYLRVGSTDGFKNTLEADARSASKITLAPGPVNTGFDAVDGGLDLAYGAWRWRVGYKLRDDMGTYAGLGQALDPVGRGKSERITTDLSWSNPKLTDHWGATVDLAYMHYEQSFPTTAQIYPPGTFFIPTDPTTFFPNGMIGAPEFADRQMRLSASAIYTGFVDHRLRVGAGHDVMDMYYTREFVNFTYNPANGVPRFNGGSVVVAASPWITPHKRKVSYVYAQDEWNFIRDWTLTAGIRRDNYSDAGGTTNPRLALVWDTAQNLTTKFLYGQAFRAPSFTELYATTNPIAQGNPSLKPETNRTLEAAVTWQASQNLLVNFNVFRYDMKDIIRSTSVPGDTFKNTGTQSGKGYELEATWDASRSLRFTGNYAYQRSFDGSTYQDAGYAPHHHVYARGDWRFNGNWLATAQVNWVADRKRSAGDTRPDPIDYKTLDLTLRTQRGSKQWDFVGSIRNLFNADVREPSLGPPLTRSVSIQNDLPLARRSVYLQAVYNL